MKCLCGCQMILKKEYIDNEENEIEEYECIICGKHALISRCLCCGHEEVMWSSKN